MFGGIESLTGVKTILIIDKEVDFCKLMEFYLSRKNFEVYTAYTLRDAFVVIEEQRPELIIADKHGRHNFETDLNEKVDSITGYYPVINFISSRGWEREGAIQYTLKKDYSKKDYYKKDYYKRNHSLWEKIVEYFKNLFK
jgi:DNA-binding NtrC family response regulator